MAALRSEGYSMSPTALSWRKVSRAEIKASEIMIMMKMVSVMETSISTSVKPLRRMAVDPLRHEVDPRAVRHDGRPAACRVQHACYGNQLVPLLKTSTTPSSTTKRVVVL